jgi:hypothetical protein
MPAEIEGASWSADAYERLGQLVDARDYLDLQIERAVVECRTNAKSLAGIETDTLHDRNRERDSYAPISWARIAAKLGVARQVAWRKYAHLVG